eukprot:6860130-Prymnesium_polylepis.1
MSVELLSTSFSGDDGAGLAICAVDFAAAGFAAAGFAAAGFAAGLTVCCSGAPVQPLHGVGFKPFRHQSLPSQTNEWHQCGQSALTVHEKRARSRCAVCRACAVMFGMALALLSTAGVAAL